MTVVIVLLVISSVVSMLWIRSLWRYDIFRIRWAAPVYQETEGRVHTITVFSGQGQLSLCFQTAVWRSRDWTAGPGWRWESHAWAVKPTAYLPKPHIWNHLGFDTRREVRQWPARSEWEVTRDVAMPHWFLLVVAGAPLCALLYWMRNRCRCRARLRQGRCLRCGYDLRATPERCPECGAPAGGARSPSQSAQPSAQS
jgi:hypothetical protein